MSPWIATLIVCAFVFLDLLIFVAVLRAMAMTWNDIPRQFPAVAPQGDAVRRDFQSFKLGLCSLGGCVHVEADETHLHLSPAAIMRWGGARAASVPWGDVRLVGKPRERGLVKARIGTVDLAGPAWAMKLAGG